ncbi:RidA family protein [Exiguobacterium sp. RIT452]|uniref:RidA family protein n=1 Tax=Exiguobacterium TaxID=33986 RepID=UPI000B58D81D|nr:MULTISPECIES: RidA family protein [unclassified Exiguobacterium]ASI34316.1 reactive intermediate/imine deaminase [Exiguobacterium sp. N4-1P]RJO96342.1 RidA family protein [Exiguobacterium sp. RIT452]HCN58360.1 RidA family protein [Exiguobacterium sp.]
MSSFQKIETTNAPAAIGPYSQGFIANGTLYASGQIPINPATGEMVVGGITEQTEQVMKNVDAILKEAGLTPDRVVKTTCYLTSMDHFAAFNDIYSDYFAPHNHFPARSCIAVKELPKGALVEVEILGLV